MDQTIKIQGTEIHYKRTGSGSPMILMHGWGCNGATLSLFERVGAEHHEVFNIDLPGFGSSQEPPTAWGVEEYTRMLEEFCLSLNIDRPILLGHSFGGRIAILFASRNPVERLVLVDAAGIKPRRSLKYYFKVYSFKLGKALWPLIMGREKAERKIAEKRNSAGSADYNNASPLMKKVLVKAVNTDLSRYMPAIKAPTLLVWGEEDTATPLADAHRMKRLIPDAGLVSFPGAGHFSFIDNPYQSAAVVRRFIYPGGMKNGHSASASK